MQTFIVYTKPVQVQGSKVNQEVGREKVDDSSVFAALEGARDYIVNKEGHLYKIVEKIADFKSDELRVLVRAA